MNRKLMVVATVVLVGAAAVVLGAVKRRNRPSHPHSADSSAHANGIDRSMSARLALTREYEGATPCERAYNAFKASQDAATQGNQTPIVLRLAPRDEFLAHCMELPVTAQPCMAPGYKLRHPECEKETRPPAEVVARMVVINPQGADPSQEPQEPQEPAP